MAASPVCYSTSILSGTSFSDNFATAYAEVVAWKVGTHAMAKWKNGTRSRQP